MNVRLISYSQPVESVTHQHLRDVQDLVAFCARVSNPSNSNESKKQVKNLSIFNPNIALVPLEMVSACLEIDTTRDIAHSKL